LLQFHYSTKSKERDGEKKNGVFSS
jgi:hypothetical protein